jgi:predicted O-methyltransferase YrrM
MLAAFEAFYHEIPFASEKGDSLRYYFDNPLYSYADGVVLYSMVRWARPRRIVEIGSGFSSALLLDTNDRHFDGAIQCTFVEPNPSRLEGLLRPSDRIDLRIEHVQDTPLSAFRDPQAGDMLIVDGSHVSKTGSDVNRVFFDVLPSLQTGVHVHIHDVFYPFEYPKKWVYRGVAWNEAYLVRAFLQYNRAFEITFFTSYMLQRHRPLIERQFPLMLLSERPEPTTADAPGGSLWLTKRA